MVEIFNKEKDLIKIENTSKLDLNILKKRGNSKTFANLLISKIKDARKNDNLETAIFLQEIYYIYKSYEKSEEILISSWKGKDKVKIFIEPDRIILIKHKKVEPGEVPKEIKSEIYKEDVNKVISAINKLKESFNNKIPTSEIAEIVYNKKWKDIFSNRQEHIMLVDILNILSHYEIIHYYRAGYSTVLKNVREIQETL